MNIINQSQSIPDYLLEPTKCNGIGLVFESDSPPSEELATSIIQWATQATPLGFCGEPYEVDLDEEDFGDGVALSFKWSKSIDCVSYEILESINAFINSSYPNSGYLYSQVFQNPQEEVSMH